MCLYCFILLFLLEYFFLLFSANMELQVINAHVKRIKGVATGRYLAINKKGRVISKVSNNKI